MGNEEEKKLRDLLIKATRDMEFREEFLKDPVNIGKKHGVSFTKEQLAKIESTYKFIDSVRDIIIRPVPPGYPLYPVLVKWRIDEIFSIPFCHPWYYPIPPWVRRTPWRG